MMEPVHKLEMMITVVDVPRDMMEKVANMVKHYLMVYFIYFYNMTKLENEYQSLLHNI